MNFFGATNAGFYLDSLGLIICLITVFLLVREKRMGKGTVRAANSAGSDFTYLVEDMERKIGSDPSCLNVNESRPSIGGYDGYTDFANENDIYKEASYLAEMGLGPREISRRLDMEKAEIELIMSIANDDRASAGYGEEKIYGIC
jgi:hypothetical protein